MRYKAYIDYGFGYQEFFPDNIGVFKITRDKTSNQIMQFFSRIEWGEIQISNKPLLFKRTNNEVYRLYNHISNIDFSQKILVKQVTDNITIVGYFGRNDCEFDDDNKTLKVTPATIDQYTVIFENWEKEVDLSNFVFDDVDINIPIQNSTLKTINDWPTYEGVINATEPVTPRNRVKEDDYNDEGLLTYFDGNKPKETLFRDSYWGFMATHYVWDNQVNVPIEFMPVGQYFLQDRISILGQSCSSKIDDAAYGPTLDMHYGDYELSKFRIYEGTRTGGISGKRWRQLYCQTWFTRDEIVKEDVVDISNPFGYESPVGEGWSMRKSTFTNGKNAHTWTRKPFNGAYSDNWILQAEVLNTSESQYDWNWSKYRESILSYGESGETTKISNSILLRNLIEYIVSQSESSMSDLQVKSTFLFNDEEELMPILQNTTGFNYVTGKKNYLNNIRLFFTKDLVVSDKNTIKANPKYSLKTLLDEINLWCVNTLCWFIDTDGTIRIEHIKFTDIYGGVMDISNDPILFNTSKWSYDKTDLYERILYNQVNSGYKDFTNNIVTFDKIVSNNRNKDSKYELSTQFISTDVRYCLENPSGLSDGFIFVALDENNYVLSSICELSGLVEINGPLALSNMLVDFGTYEGVSIIGKINGKTKNFNTTIRSKIGNEIELKGLKNSLFYITQIGYGLIEDGSIDFEKEYTKIKLRYRFHSSQQSRYFILSYQKAGDFSGAVNVWANLANYQN